MTIVNYILIKKKIKLKIKDIIFWELELKKSVLKKVGFK